MAENFYTILTSIGKSKLANSTVLGSKVNLKTLQVGDGNGTYHELSEDQTSLINKVWESDIGSISVDKVNSNWIVIQTTIPATDGGFYIREAGIFDEDGDLIAVSKVSETYKPVISEGSAKDVSIKIVLEVSNVENITMKIDPNVIVATKNDIEVIELEIQDINTNISDMEKRKANQSDLDITNANLTMKADETDNSRSTTSKTVTGAINELNTNKAPIANPTFSGTVKTANNTLDDGNGNANIKGNLSASGGLIVPSLFLGGATTLTNSAFGSFVELTGNSAYTIILPSPANKGGATISFWNNSTVQLTIATAANAIYGSGASGTSVAIPTDSSIVFISDGYNWIITGGTYLFNGKVVKALGGAGYKIQSGSGTIVVTANIQSSFSITFPSTFSSVPIVYVTQQNPSATLYNTFMCLGGASTTGCGGYAKSDTTQTLTYSWLAIGN